MKRIFKYFGEVRSELKQVSWPKKSEVIKLTLIVLLICLIFGVYLGILDFGFTKLLSIILAK